MILLFHSPTLLSNPQLRLQALAMLHTHNIPLHFSPHFSPSPPLHNPSPPSPLHSPLIFISLRRPPISAIFRPWLADLPDSSSPPSPIDETEGPVEIPSSSSSPLFAIGDNPTPLQTATSVLLTGVITVFLFRSLRRRAQRAKDLALLGGITAGVIAVFLYKFATTVEAGLNRQTISDNFSVRQLTITIRTIVNGLCYLATFVFGINSIGLILYSIQLAFSSVMEGTNKNSSSIKGDVEKTDATDPFETSAEDSDSRKKEMPESSDEP